MKTQHPSRLTLGKLLAATATCLAFQSAQATLLFSEAFDYDAGALQGQVNPGDSATWTGGNSGLTIASGNLTYSGLADQGGNELSIANGSAGSSYINYANQTSGQIYYSFLFEPTVVNSGNNYFIALNSGTSTPNGGNDAIDAYYYTSGKIELRANAQSATAGTGIALTLGTTYLIVEEIDLDAKTASLWIDPDSSTFGGAAPTATATLSGITGGTSGSTSGIDNIGVKAQSGTGAFYVDNILIGTTWADVTPTAAPEPATLALVGMGLAGLAAGYRRSRK